VLPPTASVAAVIERIEQVAPGVVFIAALPPEGGPYARQLCHQIKTRFPSITIVAFRPSEPDIDPATAATRLKEAGADHVVVTLAEAAAQLSRTLTTPHAPTPGATARTNRTEP